MTGPNFLSVAFCSNSILRQLPFHSLKRAVLEKSHVKKNKLILIFPPQFFLASEGAFWVPKRPKASFPRIGETKRTTPVDLISTAVLAATFDYFVYFLMFPFSRLKCDDLISTAGGNPGIRVMIWGIWV